MGMVIVVKSKELLRMLPEITRVGALYLSTGHICDYCHHPPSLIIIIIGPQTQF